MNKKLLGATGLLTVGLLAGGIASVATAANAANAGAGVASASSTANPGAPDTSTPPAFGRGDHDGDGPGAGRGADFAAGGIDPVRSDEKSVDAATATKLTDLALVEVPDSTVIRVETDGDGAAYEVHLKKADGSLVTVKFDSAFAVIEVQAGMGKGPHGAGPHGKAMGKKDGMGHGRHGAPGQDKNVIPDATPDVDDSTSTN